MEKIRCFNVPFTGKLASHFGIPITEAVLMRDRLRIAALLPIEQAMKQTLDIIGAERVIKIENSIRPKYILHRNEDNLPTIVFKGTRGGNGFRVILTTAELYSSNYRENRAALRYKMNTHTSDGSATGGQIVFYRVPNSVKLATHFNLTRPIAITLRRAIKTISEPFIPGSNMTDSYRKMMNKIKEMIGGNEVLLLPPYDKNRCVISMPKKGDSTLSFVIKYANRITIELAYFES